MPTVTMPQLGESVAEGTIGKWLKQVGDTVELGEPIVEVVTDKVNAEVPSPFAGTLTEIFVEEGQTVPNDANIAVIEAVDSEAATPASEAEPAASAKPAAPAEPAASAKPAAQAPEPAAQAPEPAPPAAKPAALAATPVAPPPPSPTPVATSPAITTSPAPATSPAIATYTGRMTPAVRRLAREHDVDLAQVPGTGFGGRVTRDDITSYVAAHPATNGSASATNGSAPESTPAGSATTAGGASTPGAAGGEGHALTRAPAGPGTDYLKPLSQMRRGIAAQMTRAASVPTAYETVEVDMSAVIRLRDRSKRAYTERERISLSFVAFVTKAAVEALRRQPDLNSHWTEEGHWIRAAIDIGVAVAVDDGLMVPVVRDADALSIHGLNRAINEVAARTRNKKLKASDIGGGTFTVDNTGWTGSILTLPILNVPEVAILTMEAIVKRPVVIESAGGDSIAIRPMMAMVLGFDHRATDGAQAGRFLTAVKRWLELVDDTTPIW